MRAGGYSVSRIQRHGYLFVLPTLVFFFVFLIYPMLSAFDLSFFRWNLLGPKVFVGLKNFEEGLTDSRVINSFFLTLQFSAISVVAINLFAFILALMLSSRLIPSQEVRNLLQSFIFLPVILSVVAIGVVWDYMFQLHGLVTIITRRVFGVTVNWLTDTRVAPYAIIIVYVWQSVGYYMVIYIAGLLDVPSTLYESARIDGAGFWGQLLYITLPSLRTTITLAVVSSVIFTFGQFPLQYVITNGGPSRSTEILGLLIYKEGFHFSRFGFAGMLSVVFFVTLLAFSLIQLRLLRSDSSFQV